MTRAVVGQLNAQFAQVNQAVGRFNQDLGASSTRASVLASEAITADDQALAGMKEIDKEVKEKRGNKELSEMSSDELQSHYENVYKEVFLPARAELQRVLKEKSEASTEFTPLERGRPFYVGAFGEIALPSAILQLPQLLSSDFSI